MDEMDYVPANFLERPWLSITANYAGSDGSCPESMEITIGKPIEDLDLDAFIAHAVNCLATIPNNTRWQVTSPGGSDHSANMEVHRP